MAGFFSKVVLFTTSWGLGLGWLVIIALLNSIISLVYYGRVVRAMFFDAPQKNDRLVTPVGLTISLGLATLALIVLTIFPNIVLEPARLAGLSLFALLPR